MAYTTIVAVQQVLGYNYDEKRSPDLKQFIDTAHAIVLRVETGALAKGTALTGAELELIERWLSAHCYVQMDPLYMTKHTSGPTGAASGAFQRAGSGKGFESTEYGKMAIQLDYSGTLKALGDPNAASAGGFWLGGAESCGTASYGYPWCW